MKSFALVIAFVAKTFPAVKRELAKWRQYARHIPDRELSLQALASIEHKTFHCLGGGIYSLYPGAPAPQLVSFIVALQTISDYLDNLCDRAGIADEEAFRQLHLAMTDALTPGKQRADYYRFYPHKEDNGYLEALVYTCQQILAAFPSYARVQPYTLRLAALYSELQTYKHTETDVREERMLAWTASHQAVFPEIGPWEFSAATGSTLGLFLLCALAAKPNLTDHKARQAFDAYFPWICGLHILLDYFIDRKEDEAGGDLNFVAYYRSDEEINTRLSLFWRMSLAKANALPEPVFHTTVIRGLFAMYLSDAKTDSPENKKIRDALLQEAGTQTRLLYSFCRLLRRQGVL